MSALEQSTQADRVKSRFLLPRDDMVAIVAVSIEFLDRELSLRHRMTDPSPGIICKAIQDFHKHTNSQYPLINV